MTLTEVINVFLCCPYDHSELKTKWQVEEQCGTMQCVHCQRTWAITEGIPSLMPDYFRQETKEIDEDSEEAICLSEISMRDTQADEYDRILSARRDAIEIPTTLREFQVKAEDVVVELGVGTGRALKYADSCKLTIACDFSLASLRKLKAKGLNNVMLVQADATMLPLRSECVNAVLSVGVFHHIPSQKARSQHLQECQRVLCNGGQYVMSGVYNFTFLKRLRDLKTVYTKDDSHEGADGKTGYHTNNTIYYYNFDLRELRIEVERYFHVADAFGFWVDIWIHYFGFFARLIDRLLGSYRVDRFWQRTWIGDWFGRELLVRMVKER